MAYLILVRHGRSEWNDKGLWTGWTDIPLNDEGRQEARHTAQTLKDIKIDAAYSSNLVRVTETIEIILKELGANVSFVKNDALKERNYGTYTGKNKWQVKEQIGDEEFKKLRRSWDYPLPEGESLKMVYERVIPYYKKEILPQLKKGKNILVGGSGNSLRALIKFLDNVPDEGISEVEIRTGEAWVYQLDKKGKVISRKFGPITRRLFDYPI